MLSECFRCYETVSIYLITTVVIHLLKASRIVQLALTHVVIAEISGALVHWQVVFVGLHDEATISVCRQRSYKVLASGLFDNFYYNLQHMLEVLLQKQEQLRWLASLQ